MNAGTLEIQLAADVARLRSDMGNALGIVQRTARGFDDAAAQMRGALGGIGGGLSAAAFGTWIKSAIDFQDQLNDLNKTTDIAVSKLAGISLMSKQTGSDLTGMAQAMNKLTLEMGKAPEKFAKIGITAKDPLEAFKQLSDIFTSIEDPQLRAAVAAEALGKGWASAAPALAEGSKAIGDMVTRGEELAGITKLDAEMADAFNDSMSELQLALMGTASNLAGDMLPLLTELVKSLTDVTASANNTETPFNILTETLRALIVIGGNVAFVIHGIAVEIGGMAAQAAAFVSGNFSQAAQIGRDMTADAERRRVAFDAWEQRMMSAGKTARGEAEETKRSAQTLSDAVLKSFVDSGAGAKAANKELEEQARLLAELAGLSGSFAADWARLNTIYAKGAITVDQLTEAQEKLLAQQPAMKKMADERKHELEIGVLRNKQVQERAELEAKVIKSAEEMVKQAQFELSIMGLSNVEREKAIALRQLEATGIDKATLKYAELAEAMSKAVSDRAAMQKQIDDFQNVWNSIDRTAQQTFTNIFEGGQDAFTKLRDTLKATLLDLLYQMTVRKWVFNVAANVTGTSSGAANSVGQSAFGGQNMMGMLSNGSSLWNIGSQVMGGGMSVANGAGTIFANATGTGLDGLLASNGAYGTAASGGAGGLVPGIGGALGAYGFGQRYGVAGGIVGGAGSAMLAGGVGGMAAGTGFAAGATGALAAMGPWGWAAIAAMAILGAEDKGGPKTEGGADLAGVIQQQYNGIAEQLGITNKAIFEAFYSKDPLGDSLTQLRVATMSGGRNVYERLGEENVGRSDEEFAAAVGDATTRAIIAALKDSDLAQEYKQYLDALADDASNADIERAISLIGQRKALDEEWLTVTSTDAENLARARQRELDAMDPTLRAIKERIWAEQDLRRESEATAAMQTRLGDALLDQVRTAESAARDAIARQDAAAVSLRRYLAALTTGPMAALSPEAQYQATRSEFMRLSSLSLDDPERQSKLEEVGTAFLEASRSYNASSMAYFTDLAMVRGAVEASQVAAQTQADIGRMQLTALQSQYGMLSAINGSVIAGNLTVSAAIASLAGALSAAGVNGVRPTTPTGGGAADYYADNPAAAAPDPEGIAFWNAVEQSGAYRDMGYDSAQQWFDAHVAYLNSINGSHANGLAYVPFDGYRAELHQGERVLTAAQARTADAGYMEMVTELRGLRSEVARLTAVSASGMQANLGKQDMIISNTAASADRALLASVRGVEA